MNIRDANPNDPQDVQVICVLIRELAESIGESSPVSPGFVRKYLSHPGSAVLLAEEGGMVCGLLSYAVKPDLYHAGYSAEIEALVVTRQARGKGVASLLISHILNLGESSGWAEISVSTGFDNRAAQDLYRRHGLRDESLLLERHL